MAPGVLAAAVDPERGRPTRLAAGVGEEDDGRLEPLGAVDGQEAHRASAARLARSSPRCIPRPSAGRAPRRRRRSRDRRAEKVRAAAIALSRLPARLSPSSRAPAYAVQPSRPQRREMAAAGGSVSAQLLALAQQRAGARDPRVGLRGQSRRERRSGRRRGRMPVERLVVDAEERAAQTAAKETGSSGSADRGEQRQQRPQLLGVRNAPPPESSYGNPSRLERARVVGHELPRCGRAPGSRPAGARPGRTAASIARATRSESCSTTGAAAARSRSASGGGRPPALPPRAAPRAAPTRPAERVAAAGNSREKTPLTHWQSRPWSGSWTIGGGRGRSSRCARGRAP